MAAHATRQGHLAAMHMTQKALGLSNEDASALKLSVTGQASAADMNEAQRRQYLAHLSNLQARASIAAGHKPAWQSQRTPMRRATADDLDERWRKARALWAALARAGHVRTDTDAALMAYVRRQVKVEHWRFLNTAQINNVIEALKRWCVRVGVGGAAHEVAGVGAPGRRAGPPQASAAPEGLEPAAPIVLEHDGTGDRGEASREPRPARPRAAHAVASVGAQDHD